MGPGQEGTPLTVSLPEAAPPAAPQALQDERCLVFSLGELLLAVPAARLREVGEVPRMAPLPLVPAWVRGLANLRGDLLAVVDLLSFLGGGELPARPTNRLLVLGPPNGEAWMGLLAARIHGMSVLPPEEAARSTGPRSLPGLLRGSFRHPAGTAAMLDVDRLMATLKEAKETL